MSEVQRLQRNGDECFLTLSRELLDRLEWRGDESVELEVREGSLVVTLCHMEPIPPRDFQECLDEVIREHGDVLRRLAQH